MLVAVRDRPWLCLTGSATKPYFLYFICTLFHLVSHTPKKLSGGLSGPLKPDFGLSVHQPQHVAATEYSPGRKSGVSRKEEKFRSAEGIAAERSSQALKASAIIHSLWRSFATFIAIQ